MFEKIINAITNFLNKLFGGGGIDRPTTDKPTRGPRPTSMDRPDLSKPQDGAEVKPDTIKSVINEHTLNVIEGEDPEPDEIDEDFTNDVFDDNEDPIDTPTGPTTNEPTDDVIVVPDPEEEADITTPEPEPDPIPVPEPAPDPIPEPEPESSSRYIWILDNGHGRLTAGKRSPKFDGGKQLLEYQFNRDIVVRIMRMLDELEIDYFDLVPDFDKVGNILEERVGRANKSPKTKPRIYVSIHANAGPAGPDGFGQAHGVETWYYRTSGKGKRLAAIFQKHIVKGTNWRNRHLKTNGKGQKGFYVLRNTYMPAVLTESGFYNNKQQVRDLMKDEVREAIAVAHVNAILEIEKITGLGG